MLRRGVGVHLALSDRLCAAAAVAAGHNVHHSLVARPSFGADFDRHAYTVELVELLTGEGIELVVMAGFGTVLDQPMYDCYPGRVLNTHPALLPSFPGWHAVRDSLSAGVKVTGCTVHVATLQVDAGPILAQAAVDVLPDDTVETLHERIKIVERELYVDTIVSILERGYVLEPDRQEVEA